MGGVFGVDMQQTETVIALAESDTARVAVPVGDGHRALIPHAVSGGSWGSPAAQQLAAGTVTVDGAPELRPWLCNPRSPDYLRGLQDRLFRYLGRTAPTHRHGYQVTLSVAASVTPISDPSNHVLLQRCTAAGLTDVTLTPPTESLVCRWLADPATPVDWDTTVISVACGGTGTTVSTYRVVRTADDLSVTRGRDVLALQVGGLAGADRLARTVLDRCREGVPTAALLPLLDGVNEHLASLRSGPRTREVIWQGPLATRMFSPLVCTAGDIATWPEYTDVHRQIQEAVSTLVPRRGAASLVLIGGTGAVGPFLADALSEFSEVWHSPDPEVAVAVGAARWPRWRSCIHGESTVTYVTAGSAVSSGFSTVPGASRSPQARTAPAAAEQEPETPPWLRDV